MKSIIKLIDQRGLSIPILIISDIIFYCMSFLLAFYLRSEILVKLSNYQGIQSFETYISVLPIVLLIMLVIFYFYGLYGKQSRITGLGEIITLSKALSYCWLIIMAAAFLARYDYSRVLIIAFWLASLILLNFGRYLIRKIQNTLYRNGYAIKKVLIIGSGKLGRNIAQKLEDYRDFGYQIIGFLDDKAKEKTGQYKLLGQTNQIIEIIKKKEVALVYIADPSISHENILNIIHQCEGLNVQFKVVSDLFEIVAGSIDINEIEGIPMLDLSKNNDRKLYDFSKRIIDLILGFIALIMSLPLWLMIIISIKIDSQGQAIFIQERVGMKGELFKMYKFRTMYKDSDENNFAPKNANDKRITNIGKLLRKTSLDELPQLLNVLKGEMSLVGPRPEMKFIVAKYKDWQKKRLDVKPGITGLWQILGRKDLPLHENLEYDFYYIKNRSLLLDIVILFKTISAVLFQRGAY